MPIENETPRRSASVRPARAVVGALVAIAVAAATAVAAGSSIETPVRVERTRPQKEKHPTLRFLKANREFIREMLDELREKPLVTKGGAESIDPRFLAYRDMLAEIMAAKDSTWAAQDAARKRDLLQSITQLGELEAQLDLLDRLLEAQRLRLGVLQEDFTGDQQTALAVVLSGYPKDAALSEVDLTLDDGPVLNVPLTPEQRDALRSGGVLQVFHGFVEPRELVLQVGVAGDSWPAADSGFVTLEPARDRLTLLRLDLSTLAKAGGASSIQATTWLHDTTLP